MNEKLNLLCNSTNFADNKLAVDRDKIQFDLIKLLSGRDREAG